LQLSEKQALVAELAASAAHELNQPLTSIIGYVQLIQRQSPKEAQHQRAAGIILSEAERMAEIVKKIGHITKYETTDYVGTARMIDLDRATSRMQALEAVPQDVDDNQTGEFSAVAGPAAPADTDVPRTPSLGDLGDLANRAEEPK
jgi:signal transduction histidine kinase